MLKRMFRSMAAIAAMLPLMMEPALAAPPTINALALRADAQTDIVLVNERPCTRKIRFDCKEGQISKNSKAYKRLQAQENARFARGVAVIGGAVLLGVLGATANRGWRGDDYYQGNGYRNGNAGSGGYKRCNSFYTTPNPQSGRSCY